MNEIKKETEETSSNLKSIPIPKLSPEEKLYVRVYLHTLSHAKAYESVKPNLSSYSCYNNTNNQFSRRENVRYHIAVGLQEKAEALTLDPETILTRLYKEAIREGQGSNHAARIQALIQLGKHFGLFEEKKDTTSHVFNIINYSPEVSNLLEQKEEEVIEEVVDTSSSSSLENIVLTEYS